jgi:hypothetical protein
MLDKDELLSLLASNYVAAFNTFAPGSVDVLLRCAESKSVDIRSNCLDILARADGKDKRVLAALTKATQDKSFGVRHNAHCALFKANDNLKVFLAYLIRIQEDPDKALGEVDKKSERGKRELTTKNLAVLGSATMMIEWSEERPEELAKALLELVGAQDPSMRHGATRCIGAVAARVDIKKVEVEKLSELFSEPVNPERLSEASRVTIHLEKLKVPERLRELRDKDPDTEVRDAARIALERLTKVQTVVRTLRNWEVDKLGGGEDSKISPAIYRSLEEVAKIYPDKEFLAKFNKDVDFSKNILLRYAWKQGGPPVSYEVKESKDGPIVVFTPNKERTTDLKPGSLELVIRADVYKRSVSK